MQDRFVMHLLAIGNVFVVGNKIMKISFGYNANEEDQRKQRGNKFLYDGALFQLRKGSG